MNNNDISLFEKVVFVDNIPSEDNARDLSTRYPFALFISDYGEFGKNGEESELPPTRDWNQFSFNNIWKDGKRLTKFNNVNPEKYSVNMDTFTIDLGFDIRTGLISLTSVAKVSGYDVVGFIQKHGTNEYSTYLNKTKIRQDINRNADAGSRITNVTMTEYNNDMGNFSEFTSTNFEGFRYYIEGFDTVNNKIYIITSFYAEDYEVLHSVPVNAFAVNSINEEFTISTKPVFIEDKLQEILDFDDPVEKQELFDLILKYTDNLKYSDKYQRCVVYELDIVKNIEPAYGATDTSVLTLSFESLKNVENINNIDIEFLYSYVNPIGFELKGFIDNEWKTINQNSVNENYFMPGAATQFALTILPANVRKLNIEASLISRVSGGTQEFSVDNVNQSSETHYNYNPSEVNDPYAETKSLINFSIIAPTDFTYSPRGENNAKQAFLNISASDLQTVVRYQISGIKLTQYLFRGLRLENPWNPIGVVTSGQQINYALPNPYAKFCDESNVITNEVKIKNNDPDMTVLLIMRPNDKYNIEVSSIVNPIILENNNSFNNYEIEKYASSISTKNVAIGSEVQMVMPWIKETIEGLDQDGKRTTTDYIYGLYNYHGYEVKDHNKYIKPDELVSISILSNNNTAISFTKALYDGDEDLLIKKINNVPITFRYYNGQTVDGWSWFMNSSINKLLDYIKIYSTYGTNKDDESTFNPTIYQNQIKINSKEDIEYERFYYAYIEFNGLKSEEINARAKRLLVDWWMYIGPFTGSGASIQPSTAYSNRNPSLAQGFWLKTNDTRNDLNNPNTYDRNAIHNGGWIHLGEVDLKTAKYSQYNPITNRYEQITNQYVIWESSENMGIDTGTTPNNLEYLVIIPKELRIKDFINTIGDYVGEYSFTGNKGSYMGYKMYDISIYVGNNTEVMEGFKFYICHELK